MIYEKREWNANANSILIFFRARAVRDTVITRSVRYIDVLMTRAIKNSETRIMRNRALCNENKSTRYAAWIPMQSTGLRARKITRLPRSRKKYTRIHTRALPYSKNPRMCNNCRYNTPSRRWNGYYREIAVLEQCSGLGRCVSDWGAAFTLLCSLSELMRRP